MDPSNRTRKWEGGPSQSAELAALLPPTVSLVKALNTVSAAQLEATSTTSTITTVPLAGDCRHAKAAVAALGTDRLQSWLLG